MFPVLFVTVCPISLSFFAFVFLFERWMVGMGIPYQRRHLVGDRIGFQLSLLDSCWVSRWICRSLSRRSCSSSLIRRLSSVSRSTTGSAVTSKVAELLNELAEFWKLVEFSLLKVPDASKSVDEVRSLVLWVVVSERRALVDGWIRSTKGVLLLRVLPLIIFLDTRVL